MTPTQPELHARVADLHARYVRAIDDDMLEVWPSLFSDPCRYAITTRENVNRKLPFGLIECTSQGMLADRVETFRRVNVFEPHTYIHHISGLVVAQEPDGTVRARSNFLVVRTMPDGESSLFAVGVYDDVIVVEADVALFRERIAIVESRRTDTLLALPL